jgi:hypothetical protein
MKINWPDHLLISGKYTAEMNSLVLLKIKYENHPFRNPMVGLTFSDQIWDTYCASAQLDPVARALEVVQDGGEFSEVHWWLKLPDSLLNTPVPEGLPNRTKQNGQPHTWQSWQNPEGYNAFTPCNEDGFNVRTINPQGGWASMATIQVLKAFSDVNEGVELLSNAQGKALIA